MAALSFVVPRVGLEPTRLAAQDFESCMTTNSITGAFKVEMYFNTS
jgi:hypothetical protein